MMKILLTQMCYCLLELADMILMTYSQPTAACKASSKRQVAPPLTLFVTETYDVIVIFVTSRGAKIQMYGVPEGDDRAGVVGACHDGRVRTCNLPYRWGSWDPIGSCSPIKCQIQVKLEQRLSTLSPIQ